MDYFRNYPKGTRADAANAIPDLSEDGVKYIIGRLQQLGFLKREGGRKDGYWMVIDKTIGRLQELCLQNRQGGKKNGFWIVAFE